MPKRSSLAKLRQLLGNLTLEQAKQLQGELEAMIQELEQQQTSASIPPRHDREVVQVQHSDDPDGIGGAGRLYQLERVRCGKPTCKCMGKNAQLHGPY